MKKRFLPLFAFLLTTCLMAKANPVDVQQARKIGAKYLQASTEAKVASYQELTLAATYRTEDGTAAFYVFNGPCSFVIVAADDCATPILGSSATNQFNVDDHAPALEEYLQVFVKQIEIGINSGLPALDTVAHQWEIVRVSGLVRDDRATAVAVAPLLTTTWGQGCYYNDLCPEDPESPSCEHAITGCVATAMGQIMRYWRYPIQGRGSHGYDPVPNPTQYPHQFANFGITTYDWDNMPNALTSSSTNAQINAVATLLWHCGVSVDMKYGYSGSGNHTGSGATTSDAADALKDYFKYSSSTHYDSRSDFSDDQWLDKLKTDINKGRPVLYRGRKPDDSAGHAFVCDGYNADNALHFNWGWYGDYQDDYYALDALTPGSHNYSGYNAAIFNIYPGECEEETYVHALPYHEDFEAGETEFFCFSKHDWMNYLQLLQSKWTIHASNGAANPPSGNLCAKRPYNPTSSGNCNDWLIMSPVFLQPGRDASTLTFKTYEGIASDYTFEGVYVSTTGTSTSDFTQVWTQNNPSASWKTVSIDLNAYRGQIIYIAFVYTGANGHNWYIDDVNIEQSWSPCGGGSISSLPFNATFDSNLDGCWYNIDGDMSGENKCWQWYSDGDLQCVIHPKGQEGVPQVGWLITRRVFLQPGRDQTTLSFKAGTTNVNTSASKKNSVWIAVDKTKDELAPSDFTKIWEDPAYNSAWTTYNVDLSSYQGHFVNIAFKYEGTYSHNWFIDNVNITESWSTCGTASAPYSETFDSSISDCWYIYDEDKSGGVKCWKWSSDNQCAYHPFGQEGIPQVGWLFSKKVSLPSNHAYKLTFKSKNQFSGTGRRNSVWIAIDKSGTPNTSDYTEIWVDPSYSASWTTYEIDLSAYSGHNVNIAFKYEGTYAHSWYIDDFNISQIPTYNITVSANPTGSGSVSGGGTYNQGTTCTLTATANTNYHFVKWTKNGTQVSTNASYTFTVTESATYVANFALDTYTITASANPTTGGIVSGGGTFNHGASCTLTATANTGYEFMYWKKDGTVVSSDPSYTFTVTSDGTYVAHFQSAPTGPTVTIGEGTMTAYDLPSHSNYKYSLSQQIYTADEIGGATTIQRIAFYNDGETKTRNITIYMMNTSKTVFESASDWITVTSANQVFSNDVVFTAGQWTHITLTTPFAYDGTNLALIVDDNTGSYSAGMACRVFDADGTQAIRTFSDSDNYDPLSPPGTGTLKSVKNQLILTTTGVSGPQLTVYPDASETNNTIPMYVYYFDDFTRAQHIMPASELTAMNGGQITAIKYYTNSDYIPYTSASEIDFYLKEVESPTLTSFVDKSTAQIVYHGTVQFLATDEGGETTIYFTTPFTYNGGNLLVGCDNTTNAGYKNIKFIGETGHTNAALFGSSGTSLANVTVNPATFLPKTTFTYTPGGGGGTTTQTTSFSNGWNWWSGYIELDATSLTALQEGLGSNGVTIKSQSNGFNSYMEGLGWYGSLTSINNESTYQVKTSAPCSVSLSGSAANPASHPITLSSGWTWIGYPVSTSMSLEDALSGLSPTSGDMLKSQNNGFASYVDGLGWYGALGTLNPGIGLMYKSMNSSPVSFTYPSGGSKGELKPNQTADYNHWVPNLTAYPDNMSVMAVVELDDVELQGENYELAAFANGECRGSASLMYVEPLNRHIAFLTVAGNEAVELHFGLYNTETGAVETVCTSSLQYETNAVVGSFETPYVVRFRSTTGADEWAGRLQVYPNPVDCGQILSLGLSDTEIGMVEVTVINALGVVVETQCLASQHAAFKAPNIPGVYTLRITNGTHVHMEKIVVK